LEDTTPNNEYLNATHLKSPLLVAFPQKQFSKCYLRLNHETPYTLVGILITDDIHIGILTAEIIFAEPRIINRVIYTAGVRYLRAVSGHRGIYLSEGAAGGMECAPGRRNWQKTLTIIKKYRVVFAEGKGFMGS